MGDDIVIEEIEIIYNGLFQIDLKNNTKNEHYRTFIRPDELFKKIGNAMAINHDKYMRKMNPMLR